MPTNDHDPQTPELAAADARRGPGRAVLVVGLLFLVGLCVDSAMSYLFSGRQGDFTHFYHAANAVRLGEDPYDSHTRGYLYMPLIAVVMVPLSLVPLSVAGAIWTAINTVLIGLTLWLGTREFVRRFRSQDDLLAVSAAALVALVVLADKTRSELRLGQTDAIISLALVLALRSLGKRPLMTGLWIAIVISVKFQGLIVLPYLLVRRRWSEAAWTAVWFAALTLGGAIVFGWERNLEYVARTFAGLGELLGRAEGPGRQTTVYPLEWIRSVSIPSVFARLETIVGGGTALVYAGTLLAAGAALAVGWWLLARNGRSLFVGRGGRRDDKPGNASATVALEWAGLVAAVLAFSPQTTSRHLFLLIIPVMLGTMLLVEKRKGVNRLPLLIATVVLALGLVLPPGGEEGDPAVHAWRAVGGAMWCSLAYYYIVLWTGLRWIRSGVVEQHAGEQETDERDADAR